ncbi:hypothetical protein F4777DRAFT_357530 [Nemania sp. FL0916]|nr:hypothetical protein F4777DRAFT_357530 [Nemania sp. FL0916]
MIHQDVNESLGFREPQPPSSSQRPPTNMPLRQVTNQLPPKASFDATSRTARETVQRKEFAPTGWEREEKSIETEYANRVPTSNPNVTATTSLSKGLAGSRWNPENRDMGMGLLGRSQISREPESSSSLAKGVEVVESGPTKGEGLKASRWYQGR